MSRCVIFQELIIITEKMITVVPSILHRCNRLLNIHSSFFKVGELILLNSI